jgi:hypothetical protein
MKSNVIIDILVVFLYTLVILSYIVPAIWHYIYVQKCKCIFTKYVQKHNDLEKEIVAAGYKMIRVNMWYSFIPLWNIICIVFWKLTHPSGYTGRDLYIAAKTELF